MVVNKLLNSKLNFLLVSFEKKYSVISKGFVVVVLLLFYVHGKHLMSCLDGQLA